LDIDRDWFVDKTSLIICPNNSLCFENECDVYTWKVDNGNLFLQNNSTTYLLTREDLFEKLRDTTN
jgi:hypothetical protein